MKGPILIVLVFAMFIAGGVGLVKMIRKGASQERDATAKVQVDAAKKAAERAADVERHLATEYVTERYLSEKASLALVALGADGAYDPVLAERWSRLFAASGVPNDWRVFKPAFYSSPQFSGLLSGRTRSPGSFAPETHSEHVVVLKTSHTVGKVKEPADLITDDLIVILTALKASDGTVLGSTEVRARGVGFTEKDARESGFKRAEDGISKFAQTLNSLK